MSVAGSIVANLVTRNDKWNKGFASAQSVVNKLAAGVAAFAAVGVQRLTVVGDSLDKMSMRTGVSVQSLSQLKFASEQTGASLEDLEKGFFGLSRSVFDAQRGSKTAIDSLDRLGLSIDDLSGMSAEQQMMAVAEGMTAITDESTRGAIAQQLFGRAGRQLLPLFADGARGINKLKNEADELGLTMTAAEAALGARLTDALNRSKRATESLSMKVGAVFIPVLEKAANFTALLASGSGDWIDIAVKAGAIVVGLALGMKAYTLATIAWTKAQAVALAFQGLAGWAKLTAGVAGASLALYAVTDVMEGSNRELRESQRLTDSAAGKLKAHTAAIDSNAESVASSAAANASVTHSQELVTRAHSRYTAALQRSRDMLSYIAGTSLESIQMNMRAGHSYQELVRRHLAARESQAAFTSTMKQALAAQSALATNTEGLTSALGDQETQAEKLSHALTLLEKRASILKDVEKFGAVDDKAFNDLDAIRDRTIDKLTGFGSNLQGIRDEIDRIKGTATDATLAIRDMTEKGVPADKIAELKQAYAELAKLKADQRADEDIARVAELQKQNAEQKLTQQKSQAEVIRKELESPLDKLRGEIANVQQLVSDKLLTKSEGQQKAANLVAELPADFTARIAAGFAGPINALSPLERFSQKSGSDDKRIQLLEGMADRLRESVEAGKLTPEQANARVTARQDQLGVPDAGVVESTSPEAIAQEQRAAIRDQLRRGDIDSREAKQRFRDMRQAERVASNQQGKTLTGVAKAFTSPLDRFKAMSAEIQERVKTGALSPAQAKIDEQIAKAVAFSSESLTADDSQTDDSKPAESQALSVRSDESTRVLAGILNRSQRQNEAKALQSTVETGNEWAAESAGYLHTIAKNVKPLATKAFGSS